MSDPSKLRILIGILHLSIKEMSRQIIKDFRTQPSQASSHLNEIRESEALPMSQFSAPCQFNEDCWNLQNSHPLVVDKVSIEMSFCN